MAFMNRYFLLDIPSDCHLAALNVLIALGIVRKDGKIIYWSGFAEHLATAELRLMEHR